MSQFGTTPDLLAGSQYDTRLNDIQIWAGDEPDPATLPGILASGNRLGAGTVLAKTGAGKFVPWAPTANDGTQTAVGVLCNDIDATSSDQTCDVYVAGCFNVDWLTLPNGYALPANKAIQFGPMLTARPLMWSFN